MDQSECIKLLGDAFCTFDSWSSNAAELNLDFVLEFVNEYIDKKNIPCA